MADTTFSNGTSIIPAWLNDVNTTVYKNVINAKLYGAVGDGTTDDTTALNSAITAAISLNRPLFIPAGTYVCRDLYVAAPIKIFGSGGGGYQANNSTNTGTVLLRKAGCNVTTLNIQMNSLFQEGSVYSFKYVQIDDITLEGNWGNNSAGGGISCFDGTAGWTAPEYGHSIVMNNVTVREYNGPCLYLGINRNAALITKSVFRFSYSAPVQCFNNGDHRFIQCEIGNSGTGYSNVILQSVFNTEFLACNSYTSAQWGISIDASCSAIHWLGGQLNGHQYGAANIVGNAAGNNYPVTFMNTLCEANSLASVGVYPDFYVNGRNNVKIHCMHQANGGTVKYLLQFAGAANEGCDFEPLYQTAAYATAVVSDKTRVYKGFYGTAPISQPTSANQAAVTQTAGASYTANEQAMLGSLKTLVNQLRSDLVNLGLIKGS